MTSINDKTYMVSQCKPMGLDSPPTYHLPSLRQYFPQPQIPITSSLDQKFYINTNHPNPFTIKPIDTEWKSNELLMTEPRLRVIARVSVEDIGLKQASNYISPQHLNLGWKTCGGYPRCEDS